MTTYTYTVHLVPDSEVVFANGVNVDFVAGLAAYNGYRHRFITGNFSGGIFAIIFACKDREHPDVVRRLCGGSHSGFYTRSFEPGGYVSSCGKNFTLFFDFPSTEDPLGTNMLFSVGGQSKPLYDPDVLPLLRGAVRISK